jgi:hypothetical protein
MPVLSEFTQDGTVPADARAAPPIDIRNNAQVECGHPVKVHRIIKKNW